MNSPADKTNTSKNGEVPPTTREESMMNSQYPKTRFFIDFVIAIGTSALAFCTFYLALQTRDQVKETRKIANATHNTLELLKGPDSLTITLIMKGNVKLSDTSSGFVFTVEEFVKARQQAQFSVKMRNNGKHRLQDKVDIEFVVSVNESGETKQEPDINSFRSAEIEVDIFPREEQEPNPPKADFINKLILKNLEKLNLKNMVPETKIKIAVLEHGVTLSKHLTPAIRAKYISKKLTKN